MTFVREQQPDQFEPVLGAARGGGARAQQPDVFRLAAPQIRLLLNALDASQHPRLHLFLAQAQELAGSEYDPYGFTTHCVPDTLVNARLSALSRRRQEAAALLPLLFDEYLHDQPQARAALAPLAVALFTSRADDHDFGFSRAWTEGIAGAFPDSNRSLDDAADFYLRTAFTSTINARHLADDLNRSEPAVLRRLCDLQKITSGVSHRWQARDVRDWLAFTPGNAPACLRPDLDMEGSPVRSGKRVNLEDLIGAFNTNRDLVVHAHTHPDVDPDVMPYLFTAFTMPMHPVEREAWTWLLPPDMRPPAPVR